MDRPAIRNSWTRVAMRRVRSFPPQDRHVVLDRISRRTQNSISRARSDDWLPVALAVEVANAIVDGLGHARAVEFWRDVVYDSWVGGLLEPLVTSATSPDGIGLLAAAPAAWTLSTRDCGEVVVVTKGPQVRLEARGLPTIVRDSAGFHVMYAGALEAMLAFSKLSAKVDVRTEADGTLAFGLAFA